MQWRKKRERGQNLLEFALVLPIILIIVFGIAEFGRILLIYSEVSNASREAARFGASVGTGTNTSVNYLNCDEIRAEAQSRSVLARLDVDDIQVAYERDNGAGGFVRFADCTSGLVVDDLQLGDRVVITVSRTVTPMLGLLPLPTFNPSLTTSRTILKDLPVGPAECRDGIDNDGDGNTDYPADAGCTQPDDTIEAICYRLSVLSNPPGGGTVRVAPAPNCANQYIEQSDIDFQAFADPLFEFDSWSGAVSGTTVTNTLEITGDTAVTANFRLREADLQIVKRDAEDPVLIDEHIDYTLTVTNVEWNPLHPDPMNDVVVTDTLPADVSFVTAAVAGDAGACTHSGEATGGTIVCQVGTLVVGASRDISVRVTAPGTPATVTNRAVVSGFETDPDLSNNVATENTEIIPYADLRVVEITDAPDPVKRTATLGYQIDVANDGPSDATGVELLVALDDPTQLSFYAVNPDCSVVDSVITCPVGTLASGATTSVNTFFVPNVFTGSVTLTATVQAAEFDDDPANNDDSETTTIDTPCHPVAVLLDPPSGGAVRATPGPNCGDDYYEGSSIDFNAIPGTSYEFEGWSGSLTGTTETATLVVNGTETVTANFTLLDADLMVDMVGPTEAVPLSGVIEYEIEVTNAGPNGANGVVLTDILPSAARFVSASNGCTHSGTTPGGVVTCAIGALAANGTVSFVVSVQAPGTETTLTNKAVVSGIETDPNPVNNTATVKSDVVPFADVGIGSIVDDPDPSFIGNPITYTIQVFNNGRSNATGVQVTVPLPNTTSFDPDNSDCTVLEGVITCTIGNVAVGDSAAVVLILVPNIVSGTVELNATVAANEVDPLLENNQFRATTTILGDN